MRFVGTTAGTLGGIPFPPAAALGTPLGAVAALAAGTVAAAPASSVDVVVLHKLVAGTAGALVDVVALHDLVAGTPGIHTSPLIVAHHHK